jgi:HPt (histidine-containing phosphotransfer) domain-containing protein
MAHLDRAVLERLRATVGDDAYAELLGEFVTDSERLERTLKDACAKKDGAAAKRAAHELKGLAVLFGATELAKLCAATDSRGDLKKAAQAAALCPEVRDEVSTRTARNRRTGAA